MAPTVVTLEAVLFYAFVLTSAVLHVVGIAGAVALTLKGNRAKGVSDRVPHCMMM